MGLEGPNILEDSQLSFIMDNLEVEFVTKITLRNLIWELKKKNFKLNKQVGRKVISKFDVTVNFIFANIIRSKQLDYPLFEFRFKFFKKEWTIRRTLEDFRNLLRKIRVKDPQLSESCLHYLLFNGDQLSELIREIIASKLASRKITFIHHFIEFSFITISGIDEKIFKQTYIEKNGRWS